jgi:hypothetical protein
MVLHSKGRLQALSANVRLKYRIIYDHKKFLEDAQLTCYMNVEKDEAT